MTAFVRRSRVLGEHPAGVYFTTAMGYVGPGDVVAGAIAWWGLRAYTNASIGGNVVNIRRSSDNTSKTFVSLAGGGINTIDAFFDGSNYFVTTLYDQTGNGHDMAQATAANQPSFFLNGIGSLPAMAHFSSTFRMLTNALGSTIFQPYTVNITAMRTNNFTTTQVAWSANTNEQIAFLNSANTVYFYTGAGPVNETANDNIWHVLSMMGNGASSAAAVDGTTFSPINIGTNNITNAAPTLSLGGYYFDGSTPLDGVIQESGVWTGDKSASFSALNTNSSGYWLWSNYDTATQAWVQQVLHNGGSVSPTRQGVVDTLIKGLKSDGIWSKLDRLWLFAAENQTSAFIDLVGLTASITPVGSPTFTVDRGYTGIDAGTAGTYLDMGWNPSTNGVQFTLNSAHASAWSATNNAVSNGGALFGAYVPPNYINLYDTANDGNIYARINDNPASGSQGAPGTKQGHWIVNRSGASSTQLYQNGSNFSSPNAANVAIPNTNFAVLASHGPSGTYVDGTPNQVAMFSVGGSLSSTDASNFYSRLRTYMTAVGVP
jgi:hypothetical protein